MCKFFAFSRAFREPAAAVIGVTTLIAALSGCQSNSTGVGKSSGDIVATVNGDPITKDDLYNEMQQYIPPAKPSEDTPAEPVGRVVLSELIQNKILMQLTVQKKAPVTDAEVNDRFDYIKNLSEKLYTTQSFDEYLAAGGYTIDTFKEEQIKPLVARFNLTSAGQTTTDAEVQAYYDQNIAKHTRKYSFPLRAHIQRIVVNSKIVADAACADAKISNSFKNFAAQSMRLPFSSDADPADSPHWVILDSPSQQSTIYPPEVMKAIKTAKAGDVLAPINSMGWWWVVRVVDIQPASSMPLSQIKDLVKTDLLADKGIHSNTVMDLEKAGVQAMQAANIVINMKQYQSLVAQLKSNANQLQPPAAPTAPNVQRK
jgi:parvulin-like peptidyl-prolyl isomerase